MIFILKQHSLYSERASLHLRMSRSWCRWARPAARRRGAGRGSPAGRSCPGRSAARTRPGLSTGTVADIYIFSSGNTLQRWNTIVETFNWNPGALKAYIFRFRFRLNYRHCTYFHEKTCRKLHAFVARKFLFLDL